MYNDILGEREEVVEFKIETIKLKSKTRKLKVRWSLELEREEERIKEKVKKDLETPDAAWDVLDLQRFLQEEFSGFIEKDKSPISNAIMLLKKAIDYSEYVKDMECAKELF